MIGNVGATPSKALIFKTKKDVLQQGRTKN